MTIEEIEKLKTNLVSTNKDYKVKRNVLDLLKLQFDLENEKLISEVKELGDKLTELNESVRKSVEEYYLETGNKSPSEHFGIRMTKTVLFDKNEALEWARKTGMALKLDESEFKKLAKTSKDIDFVVIQDVPQATISSKLYES